MFCFLFKLCAYCSKDKQINRGYGKFFALCVQLFALFFFRLLQLL